MSGVTIRYKFGYNSTITDPLPIDTQYIERTVSEKTVIKETPSGARYKQVFGSGKVAWTIRLPLTYKDEFRDVFQAAYDAQVAGYAITLYEENNSGGYDEYTSIINLPGYTPETIGSDAVDRDISVEIYEA